MSNFKIGDRVKCVKAHSNPECPLVIGREYIVYNINICCQTTLDVGFQLPQKYGCICSFCNTEITKNGPTWWIGEIKFVKVEEKVNYVKLEIKIEEPILN